MILSATAQHALRAVLSLASGAVEPPVRASELAIPSEKLSLLEVVAQFDDLGLEGKCLFWRVECGRNPCPVHERWGDVAHQVVDFFSSTTIADVLE